MFDLNNFCVVTFYTCACTSVKVKVKVKLRPRTKIARKMGHKSQDVKDRIKPKG